MHVGIARHAEGTLRGKDDKRPPTRGGGAHGSRKNFAAAHRAGCRPRSPIRINDSGRPGETGGWHGEAARRRAVARGAGASSIPRRERLASRED